MVAASALKWIPYPVTETLGFVTGATCVYMVVREDIANFPVGIANNIFLFFVFLDAKIYGDMSLQVVYLALGIHGWRSWLRGKGVSEELRPRYLTPRGTVLTLVLGVAPATFVLMPILKALGGMATGLDALTTALSLTAQYLLNRKFIQNWWFWITADVLYIYLYLDRGLQLTAILYAAFVPLCITGLIAWNRALIDAKARK